MSQFWNHKLLGIALTLSLVSVSSFAQNSEQVSDARTYLPKLSSPQAIEAYEAYLKEVLPSAYNKGRFTLGVNQNISQEQIFLKRMEDPKLKALYKSELPKRSPFQELEIDTYERVFEVRQNLKPQTQKALVEKFAVLNEQYPTVESRVQKMSELVFTLNGQSSQGLLIGLIQSLPPELKGNAFKLDFEFKLEYLKANLTIENFKANFKSTYYNVENMSPELMLNEVNRLLVVESEIAVFSLFTYWKNNNFKNADMYKLREADLSKDVDYLSQFKLPAAELSKVKEAIKNTTQTFIKLYSSESVQTLVPKLKDHITIEEVSPHLGLYRGEINNNCSTTMAFGFVYSPAERTYVLKKNGKVLFTIAATEVKMNGKKTLYIHDMGQLNASPDLGEYVMRAFYGARKELGFEQIGGGFKPMHYSNFGGAMFRASKNQEKVDIEYVDGKTRNAIGDLMVEIAGPNNAKYGLGAQYSKSHDIPEAHSKGYIFEPKESYEIEISSRVRNQAPEKLPTSLGLGLTAFAPHGKVEEKGPIVHKRPNLGIKKCEMLFH